MSISLGSAPGEPFPAVESADGLAPTLEAAFQEGGVQLVIIPVDYSENARVLVDELHRHSLGA